jgi:hypothetical protein
MEFDFVHGHAILHLNCSIIYGRHINFVAQNNLYLVFFVVFKLSIRPKDRLIRGDQFRRPLVGASFKATIRPTPNGLAKKV